MIVDKIDVWVKCIQISSKLEITHTRILSEKKYHVLLNFKFLAYEISWQSN